MNKKEKKKQTSVSFGRLKITSKGYPGFDNKMVNRFLASGKIQIPKAFCLYPFVSNSGK